MHFSVLLPYSEIMADELYDMAVGKIGVDSCIVLDVYEGRSGLKYKKMYMIVEDGGLWGKRGAENRHEIKVPESKANSIGKVQKAIQDYLRAYYL